MALKPSVNVLVALCLTASAALFFFGTGLTPVWMLLWLAPIPVLWLAPRIPRRTGISLRRRCLYARRIQHLVLHVDSDPGMGHPAQCDCPSLLICYRRCAVSSSRSARPAVAGGVDLSRLLGDL